MWYTEKEFTSLFLPMIQTFLRRASRLLPYLIGSLALFIASGIFAASSAEASFTLTAGSNATTTPSVATSITGFQVVGEASATTPVQLRVTSGSLSLGTTTGLTFSGPSTGASINFTGTVANINAALSTLTYTRGSTGTDTLEVSLVEAGEVFFADNGHLYKFVSGSYTWSQAKTAAEGQELYGSTGYLATITSLEENEFVYNRISGDGWLGANDISVEDTWIWATGPEAGTAFYSGRGNAGGSAIDGAFHGWASGEPNDYGSGEDCGYMYASQDGEWNDFPCSATQGYVVEFGAPGDLPTVVATNITIVTADVPALTSLSPTNGSSSVSPNANLVIGFSKTVTVGTGNILIKKISDDSTVETIDVTGDRVSGGGSSSITINPSLTLDDVTQYYIVIPSTAFVDASLNPFEGIATSSTWAFTTADTTGPVITSISSGTASTSTATITWTTSEAASSKLVYGPTSFYGLTTAESNTGSRVTSHSLAIEELLPCTVYFFAPVSRDASLNATTSTAESFTTAGCSADELPATTTSTRITVADGGSTSVTQSGRVLTVNLPENATATSSSVVIQIKALASDGVLASIGRPAQLSNEVGSIVFDVKAIIDGDTILDSFDQEVTITYQYSEEDLGSLDESSIWLYHYHQGAWVALNDCTVNTTSNTIRCTTPGFSVFALFGSPRVTVSSGGIPVLPVKPTILEGKTPFEIDGLGRLTLNADPDTVKGYAISLDAAFPFASIWELDKTVFALPTAQGWHTVYLRYYSITGHPSQVFTQRVRIGGEANVMPPTKPPVAQQVYQFARTLKRGSTGEDVRMLQRFLNAQGFLVSASGAGSLGKETSVYSARTAAALKRFQEAHARHILQSLGLRQGTGIFGSSTLLFVNGILRQTSPSVER